MRWASEPQRPSSRRPSGLAEETEIPYQTLINLYLRDCAEKKRRISLRWARRA